MATDKNRCGWPGESAGILRKGSEGPIKLSSTAQVGPRARGHAGRGGWDGVSKEKSKDPERELNGTKGVVWRSWVGSRQPKEVYG